MKHLFLDIIIYSTTFGINTKLNYVGVKQPDPPKKQHQDSSPVQHLDTLKGNTVVPKKTPKKVHKTLPAGGAPVVRHKTVESSDSNVLVGLGIGASAVFLLLRTVV